MIRTVDWSGLFLRLLGIDLGEMPGFFSGATNR
jgi:hypothetical protein